MAFIVFEGIDGAGKSTLISELAKRLESQSIQVLLTREPGGTELAEEVRSLLLKKGSDEPVPRAELMLYMAARAQHVEKKIKPALSSGTWVICDRFTASSVAFQCGGRGLDRGFIDGLNEYAVAGCKPHLQVLIDIEISRAAERMAQRNLDRFESEPKTFHEKVRSQYLSLVKEDPNGWLVLSSENKVEDLADKVWNRFQTDGYFS